MPRIRHVMKLEKEELRLRETLCSAGIQPAHSSQMACSNKRYLEPVVLQLCIAQ